MIGRPWTKLVGRRWGPKWATNGRQLVDHWSPIIGRPKSTDHWSTKTLPLLSTLARRILCIPATPAPSERVFWSAGLTMSKCRASLQPQHALELIFLHDSWEFAEECDLKRRTKVVICLWFLLTDKKISTTYFGGNITNKKITSGLLCTCTWVTLVVNQWSSTWSVGFGRPIIVDQWSTKADQFWSNLVAWSVDFFRTSEMVGRRDFSTRPPALENILFFSPHGRTSN
jgi:hAT family C-terminal dimerisation region